MIETLDLFSGIGGMALGLEKTSNFRVVAFCEIETYCQGVLRKHWPEVKIFSDVKELTAESLRSAGITRIDCITGGFPCQDLSLAGKRRGLTGTRSTLWKEMFRLIREIKPRWVLVENVLGLLSSDDGRFFGNILRDLASIGYDAEWQCISARDVGAPHIRKRLWIIAYQRDVADSTNTSNKNSKDQAGGEKQEQLRGSNGRENVLADANKQGLEGRVLNTERAREIITGALSESKQGSWKSDTGILRVANGIPHRIHRIKGLGNSVVPQIPEIIGKLIILADNGKNNDW